VADALRPDTLLVSIMHANNEVGTIQPITEIAAFAHAHGALDHASSSSWPCAYRAVGARVAAALVTDVTEVTVLYPAHTKLRLSAVTLSQLSQPLNTVPFCTLI